MDGRVIPLPRARARGAPDAERHGEQISVLSVELRSLRADAPALPRPVVERIHERCIRASLVVAGRRGGRLFLAGTSAHPIVDARFRGEGSASRAAHAAVDIASAVADAQRSDEDHLAASIGIGVGEASISPVGVRITRGSPTRVAELLRAAAAPAYVLLGGAGAAAPAEELGAERGTAVSIDDGVPPVPVWRLAVPTAVPWSTTEDRR